MKEESCLLEVIRRHEGEIVEDWLRQYHEASGVSPDSMAGCARELLAALAEALEQSGSVDIRLGDWADTRRILERMHSDPAVGKGNPASTARLVLALKYVLFARLRADLDEARRVADEMWRATMLLDALALLPLDQRRL